MTIKELRKMTGLSQRKFSEYFGIPIRTIQEWEQERHTPAEYWIKLLLRTWEREHD